MLLVDRSFPALMRALESGDVENVARSAHELKGACANLRASLAARTAGRLEHAARNEATHEIKQLADALRREVHDAIDFLAGKVA